MPEQKLRVSSLLAVTKLGLKLLVAGDLEAEVRGAHAIEIDGAAQWLRPGWLMLTTGMRFAGGRDAGAQEAQLVGTLVEQGVPALLFGVGPHFTEVPAPLIAAARAAGLTLISIAADVPFLQIEQHVSASVHSAETSSAQHRLALQDDLIESLSGDQPIADLVRRLSAMIKGTAVLYEESGRVVASTGEGPLMLIWGELERTGSRAEMHFGVGRWHAMARPTVLNGVGYWIVLASRRESALDELAGPILDATARLLGAIRGIRALGVSQSHAESAQLMRQLQAGLTPDLVTRTWDRMRPLRFERGRPMRAVVARDLTSTTSRLPLGAADRVDAAVQLAHDYALPVMVTVEEKDGQLSGLVGDRAILDEWAAHLARAGFHVGLSEPLTDLNLVRARLRDASRALRVAQRRAAYPGRRQATSDQSAGAVLRFEDVDLVTWLAASRSSSAYAEKVQQQFGDLFERPELVETVSAYLSSGLDARTAARTLFLHPNSVRYRLRKVEELIGAPLASTAVIANLYLALHDELAHES